jgi:hypothetical protein
MPKINLRDSFGDWWVNATPVSRGIFRVIAILVAYAIPFLKKYIKEVCIK